MKVIFSGQVKDGKFIPYLKDQFINEIKKYEGKQINISIHPFKYARSKDQNAYLWGVVYDLLEKETGQSKETLHEDMKSKYLKIVNEDADSTSELSVEEFQEFIKFIRNWAWDFLDLDIPLPNDFTRS